MNCYLWPITKIFQAGWNIWKHKDHLHHLIDRQKKGWILRKLINKLEMGKRTLLRKLFLQFSDSFPQRVNYLFEMDYSLLPSNMSSLHSWEISPLIFQHFSLFNVLQSIMLYSRITRFRACVTNRTKPLCFSPGKIMRYGFASCIT